MMRTKEQIEVEIAALEACKAYIPHWSKLGDNNHRNADLQIEELRYGIDDTADDWNDYREMERSVILDARNWKEGLSDESPSSGWDGFKPKAS